MYNKVVLKNKFIDLLSGFATYCSNNYDKPEDILKGEFFTRFRRVFPELTRKYNPLITINNLDIIVPTKETPEINYVSILYKYGAGYGRENEIGLLNEVLNDININYKDVIFKSNVNKIVEEIKYYEITPTQ